MGMLRFEFNTKSISFGYFDNDKELEVETEGANDETTSFWLSPNQINDVIKFLAEQLKSIGESILLVEEIKKAINEANQHY